jgi:diphthamide synthase (EF-2-diphthine--ammonia ligase)
VNREKLDSSFCGRVIDESFFNDLPDDVDPCGENGEFHTFCFDGPIFTKAINFQIGETITKSYPAVDGNAGEVIYYFTDII